MNHKEEVERTLEFVQSLDVSEAYAHNTDEHKADQIAIAQLKATLALVETQEAANEQARIANLLTAASWANRSDIHEELQHLAFAALGKLVDYTYTSPDDEVPIVPQQIATALGIREEQ